MPCPICRLWARNAADPLPEHHPRCPLGPALEPSQDGSCHCGATVLSTSGNPCLFCGGYTAERLVQAKAASAAGDGEGTSRR
jgi:hypothetical protein